ncbi:PAS domain S-box protein [Puia sp. P3]|uniref:PAS domain S-box protein n=1 Tax=Puia sp. P3 TaxID=3423952 RepID=UPI003D665889
MYLQNNFFQEILDKAPAEIIVADAEYRYLYANPSAVPDAAMREWMVGRTNEEFCRRAGRSEVIARARRMVFEKVLRTSSMVEWTEAVRDEKGVLQHYMHRVTPVKEDGGGITKVIIYAIRITEEKEYEEKIRRSENKYRDLYNYSQALICTHDMNGRLLAVNPAVCRTLGYTEDEMVGRNLMEFLPEKHRARFGEEYVKAIHRRDNNLSGEFSVLNKDGTEIHLLYRNYRREEPGEEPYIIGFSQDITDRITMERELRVTKQLTDDVARAKESFLAHMSHEIRTPMNGILGIASLLNKTRLDVQQRNYLQLIQESANNLLVIVNDILDLEKIVAGKLQLESIPFKIVDKIATTIQSFIYRAEEKELGLIFQNSVPGDLVVEGDPYRLSQVLNNLLSNALKFTNEGHIKVTTGIAVGDEDAVVVEVVVSDTGIGISPERLATIFEPFEQADATISRKYGGTGLGLAICKHMVEMQNGELLVKSEAGKGSAFIIRVPYHLSIEAMQEKEIRQETNYKSLGQRKILVAEDVELNQYLARHILESWEFEVVIVNNGLEALQALEHATFDCILMDVQMPEMDGIEATQHIRRLPDPVKSNIPIIALTANALKGDSEKYLAAGMNDYLAKPFDEERLFQVIYRNLAYYKTPVLSGDAPAGAASGGSEDHPFKNNNNSSTMTTPANPRLYDLSMVQSVSGGDEGFIRKMVALFIETVPQNMTDLKNAMNQENWDQVGKTAHKLKSTIDSMGIKSIRQEIRTVEANAKQKKAFRRSPRWWG